MLLGLFFTGMSTADEMSVMLFMALHRHQTHLLPQYSSSGEQSLIQTAKAGVLRSEAGLDAKRGKNKTKK